ncbi:MAG: TIGR00730 family Rossman fold protein [Dehalococcoidia bacterium]
MWLPEKRGEELPPTADDGHNPIESGADTERQFLSGSYDRRRETRFALRIAWEFIRAFRRFRHVGPCVTVFGSARVTEDDPHYDLGRRVGSELARAGFTVMTGGGPGLMEAANRGAREAGGESIGCNIDLAAEEACNRYLDTFFRFHYFFVRKVVLVKYSYAFVVLPGGLGTLDEVFETVTLMQTGKIQDFPVVLVGTDFWAPLLDFLGRTLIEGGKIDRADLDRILVTDSPEEAAAVIRHAALSRFGLAASATRPVPRRSPLRALRVPALPRLAWRRGRVRRAYADHGAG